MSVTVQRLSVLINQEYGRKIKGLFFYRYETRMNPNSEFIIFTKFFDLCLFVLLRFMMNK